MSWFLIALGAPFLWSVVNHIDKFLLSKYVKSGSVGSLLLFSSLIGLPVMGIAYLVDPQILNIATSDIFILLGAGVLGAFFVLFYLYAMNEDEASVVMPFFQTIPIFGAIMAFFLLGEVLTQTQIVASFIIFLGAAILSIDIDSGYAFKKKLVTFVLISSFLFALQQVLFKFGANGLEENFWIAIFWEHLGLFLTGVILFFCVGSYRREFFALIRNNSVPVFGLNILSESLTIVGNLLVGFASLLAPIALVQTVELYQPAIVFFIGLLITLIAPRFVKEKISKKHLALKILSILIVFIGGWILYHST